MADTIQKYKDYVLIGFLKSGAPIVRFQPPLIIPREQIDRALGIFTEALQSVAQPAHATT